MDSREAKTFYRAVNVLYAIYVFALGVQYQDPLLMGSSVLLFLADAWLLATHEFELQYLQPLRLAATLVLGPIWIAKAVQYNNTLLGLMGFSFIVFDGVLYLQDASRGRRQY